ncbi:uncharacterized protein BX663DRAFT_542660 [Cokeromyces recurvatus]|uniref:uncharacterized protein n=1 Tax=Cokeromyces recurvatus TaxID=90255 RepID=UPI00221E5DCA|nr:uncharacterized protein BX663DRAFT_542660 [Cokeromyces recurvatus]KAI7903151.1 hypothetical protein BX663DRAFT_542660 [Cokeromyces recurvatus]
MEDSISNSFEDLDMSKVIHEGNIASKKKGAQHVLNYNNRTCRHVTIKQIKNVTVQNGDQFFIDQQEITNISIIGIIRTVIKHESHIAFSIEDGTGMIDARYWTDLKYNNSTEEEIKDDKEVQDIFRRDCYVKLFGRIQHVNQRTTCVVTCIVPIEDFNEMTFHFLSAIHSHLTFSSQNTLSSVSLFLSKTNANEIIKRAIQSYGNHDVGCHIQALIYNLKDEFNETKIIQTIEDLSSEGQIYTVGDGFFKLINK